MMIGLTPAHQDLVVPDAHLTFPEVAARLEALGPLVVAVMVTVLPCYCTLTRRTHGYGD
jgi:hypothetical protein